MSLKNHNHWAKALPYLAPALIALAVIAVYPMFYSLFSSMFSWNLHQPHLRQFVGFRNYIDLFTSSRFLNSLQVTLGYSVLSVALSMILGFITALLIQKPFWGRGLVRTLLIIPLIIPPVVAGLLWRVFMLEPDLGLVNYFLSVIGIQGPAWLAQSRTAFLGIVIADVWVYTPFVMMIMDAALDGVPENVRESAFMDGATYVQVTFYIVLPMIRAIAMFTLLFRFTTVFRMFDIIYIMTTGGPGFATEVLSIFSYNTALRMFRMGYANASVITMAFIISLIAIIIIKITQRMGGSRVWDK